MTMIASPIDAANRWPDTTILAINGKTPKIHESAFIAPGTRIIGERLRIDQATFTGASKPGTSRL